MKTNARNLMMVIAAVAFTACSNTDVFDNEAVEKDLKASYAENFAKKYPNVDMSKGWDFSTKTPYFTFGSNASKARTRADYSYDFTEGEPVEVDLNTVAKMREKLTEGEDHRDLGKAFYMTVPSSEFTILPVFQGEAGAVWDLYVNVGGVNIKIWEKSQDIYLTTDANKEWHPITDEQVDSWGESQRNTLNATGVKAVPYTFKNLPVGEDMYFYLKITKSGTDTQNYWGTVPPPHYMNDVDDEMTSVDQMMLALQDFDKPSNVPDGYQYMLIGCEDANQEHSDWDMNDVVFLVYGQKIPQPIEITEGTTVYDSKTVRYMIEDLGSTDDFDFNDIVIDVTESVAKTPVYKNDVILDHWNTGETTYKAVIRHLGGTLPFVLKIGDTEYAAGGQESFQTSPNTEINDVKGYDMNLHNISVQVKQNNSSEVYNKVTFPKAGEAPMIIAVDPTQNWMPERKSVPESWFYIPENK